MVSYKRHALKTVTWRIVGTLDTFILSWFITGSWKTGLTIGGVEVITKMIIYFFPSFANILGNYTPFCYAISLAPVTFVLSPEIPRSSKCAGKKFNFHTVPIM